MIGYSGNYEIGVTAMPLRNRVGLCWAQTMRFGMLLFWRERLRKLVVIHTNHGFGHFWLVEADIVIEVVHFRTGKKAVLPPGFAFLLQILALEQTSSTLPSCHWKKHVCSRGEMVFHSWCTSRLWIWSLSSLWCP